jgi:hypothetical protein
MKTKSYSTIGSLHPFLFLTGVYLITLVFSIFICSTIFYSCNASTGKVKGLNQNLNLIEKSITANVNTVVSVAK